ncbi:YgfZ/GcvT domain-containing protein [Edaphobacter aggregans]|uniref:CAF17-like 4Fe-4S cluster assembly/insertion protein YgfZ n=1 Tax=Edaphobacter aggregans TaxID=570835 RepID=UPI00054CDFA1|nr:folate-binding protein YgfZ [Edaphobacter aggregans]
MTSVPTSNTPPAAHPGVDASSSNPQLAVLLEGAGIASLEQTGWIRVTGEDRVRWLNGMATNSVQDLAPGAGAYNFFLNAQGRIQADGTILATPEALLIETARRQVPSLIPYLDHYIIMDDVELTDVTESRHGLTLIGPKASALLRQLNLATDDVKELQTRTLPWQSTTVTLIHAYSPLVPRYELWTDSPAEAASLLEALRTAEASFCDPASLEQLRLLEGTPLYGADIRDRDLPQETNQTRALHFAKGCYLGQEIVERIRSRGSVHRTFTAFRLEGALPAPGTPLESAGKQVGELTSVASIPLADTTLQFALGYLRREVLDRHDPLQYSGGIAVPAPSPSAEAQAATSASDSSERP